MRPRIIQKFSITGVLLMALSSLTAAIFTDESDNKRINNDNATLLQIDIDGGIEVFSCVADITNNWSCTQSFGAATFTTVGNLANSFVGNPPTKQTVGNTSLTVSPIGSQDQTSQVI